MSFIIKYVYSDSNASPLELLLSNIQQVSVTNSPLGQTLTASLADETSWTFGPYPPTSTLPPSVIYIMNDSGKTVDTYRLTPGTPEAWSDLLADSTTTQSPSTTHYDLPIFADQPLPTPPSKHPFRNL